MDRESPQEAGKAQVPPVQGDDLPAVRASSDIMWLYRKMYDDRFPSPRYFLSLAIGNMVTLSILSRAIREVAPAAQTIAPWPGYEFDTGTAQGQAILGKYLVRI